MSHRINISPTAKQYSMIQAMCVELGLNSMSQTVMYLVMQSLTAAVSTSSGRGNVLHMCNTPVTDVLHMCNVEQEIVLSSSINNNNTNTTLFEEGGSGGEKLSGVTDVLRPRNTSPKQKSAPPELVEMAIAIRGKLEAALKVYPDIHKLPEFNANGSALVLSQAIRIEKIPQNKMLQLWDFIIADDFWRKNMLSIENCRKNHSSGPKILQCWRKMNATENYSKAVTMRTATEPIEEPIVCVQ